MLLMFGDDFYNDVDDFDDEEELEDEDVEMQKVKKKCQDNYLKEIEEKPIFICTCCHRLLYKKSTIQFHEERYNFSDVNVHATLDKNVRKTQLEGSEYICKICDKHLRKKFPDMPPQAAVNIGLLDVIPEDLKEVNGLERRSFGRQIPFMIVITLPRDGQFGINGACVNVPAKLNAVCDLLPRMPEEADIVDFKLKRKLKYHGHHMSSTINLQKIITALKWLKENNPKYSDVEVMGKLGRTVSQQ